MEDDFSEIGVVFGGIFFGLRGVGRGVGEKDRGGGEIVRMGQENVGGF